MSDSHISSVFCDQSYIQYYLKLDHWIMQFESFHWLSHHGKRKRDFWGRLLFLFQFSFIYFGSVFDKTIIPLALVGYEMIIAISYPTCVRGIIVHYNVVVALKS